MIQGVPPQLFLNADETSVEVSLPKKVIIPDGEEEGKSIDKSSKSSHISAMITINATGDDFQPNVLVPLKYAPNVILQSVEFATDSELRIIEEEAFFCSSIVSISIPSHVTRICTKAFSNCSIQKIEFQANSELQIIEKEEPSGSLIESIKIV